MHGYEGEFGILVGWHLSHPSQKQVVILNSQTNGWQMNEGKGQVQSDIVDWGLVKHDRFMYVALTENGEVDHAR